MSILIEEKMKKAAQELPEPQSTFKNILERAEQKLKDKCLWAKLVDGLYSTKDNNLA